MAGGTATSFTYDPIGNRLTEVAGGTTTYTYPSTNSKLSSVGANSYTYDAMGNVTGDTARTYVWSAAGLLKEAKIGGSTVGTYTYDASNLRTKKVAGGTTTQYVHGLGGLLSGEYDNSGVLIREYIWLNGEPLAQIDKSGGTETVIYLHTDHLATPRYGTSAAGSTVWTWDSGAFGKEAPTGTATVNLRFPGQYFDAEITLHYNWNRFYNPATGRYISSDPIGLAGGLNTFGYALQSPVVYYDPEGREVITLGTICFVGGTAFAASLSGYCLNYPDVCQGAYNEVGQGISSIPDKVGSIFNSEGSNDPPNTPIPPPASSGADQTETTTPAGPPLLPGGDDGGDKKKKKKAKERRAEQRQKALDEKGYDPQRRGPPGNNEAQNEQARAAANNVGGLTEDQAEILHREISGQGYTLDEIEEIARAIKNGTW